jgi:hypothetical protein
MSFGIPSPDEYVATNCRAIIRQPTAVRRPARGKREKKRAAAEAAADALEDSSVRLRVLVGRRRLAT